MEQLLGENIRLIYDMNSAMYMYYDEQRKEDGLNGSTHTYTYYENVKLYVHYNFAYMAVWAPESQS